MGVKTSYFASHYRANNKYKYAADKIRALAKKHGVTAEKHPLGHLTDLYAELSGDTPKYYEIDVLCANLFHAGVVTKARSFELLGRHLRES